MAKKKINVILIIVVLGLWGAVAYKTINQYFFSKEIVKDKIMSIKEFDLRNINKDTFDLEKLGRDPFLNKIVLVKKSNKIRYYYKNPIVIKKTDNIVPKPKGFINWPPISYHGYIKSTSNCEEKALVKIGEKFCKLKKNDENQGVVVKNISKSSVEINFNGENKIIQKSILQ